MKGFETGKPRKRYKWTKVPQWPRELHNQPEQDGPRPDSQPIRVAKMNLEQNWETSRRTMEKTGARERDPGPGLNNMHKEDWTARINRIMDKATTRKGIHGIIEATEGIGGVTTPTYHEGKARLNEWFAPFVEEYDGKNPVIITELEGERIKALLDTGAQVHIIGNITLRNLLGHFSPLLQSTRTTATDVKGRPVPILGTATLEVTIGGSSRNLIFEVIEGADTLIIGNKILYEEDLVLIGRRGIGTRKMATKMLATREEVNLPVYAKQDELIERGDSKRITVKVKGPRRHWGINVNRIFLIDANGLEGLQINPTISHLTDEGELVAIISNTTTSQDMTIEKGTKIAIATTEYEEGEQLVAETMAALASIQAEIQTETEAKAQAGVNHISSAEIINGQPQPQGAGADVLPPGFQLDGPQPGGITNTTGKGKYDSERENQGGTWETAHIHFENENHKQRIRMLLKKHQKIFSRHNYDIGHFAVDGVVQKVKLKVTDSTPIVERYRQISPAKRETAEAILQQLEKAKIITRKASGFASQAVWVQKALPELTPERAKELGLEFVPGAKDPTGKRNLRFCQDFRTLNSRLETVQWPMPAVKQVLARLGRTKYVSVLDASHSFYCIELDEESKIYTGFQACERSYVMNRLAMGLSCSSGVLNACLAKTLQGLEHCVVPYSDNILVMSDSAEQHIEDLTKVLKTLQDHGWVFKLAKCHWAVSKSLKVFGMQVDLKKKTIAPDEEKLKTVRETPKPTNKKQLRSFLGSVGYFVECLPDIGRPLAELNDLTKTTGKQKGDEIAWTQESESAFHELMNTLARSHEIHMPDWEKPMHLVTDAGPKHTAAMLAQERNGNWLPLGFYSKKLSPTEQNLSQIEKEALAIIYGLKQTNYYTSHVKTFIHSDNKPFVLLKKYASQNTKLSRYKMFIDAYDHVLVWNKSTEPAITMVDFLSRPPSKKLLNRQITKEDLESIPENIPDGIYTPEQYNHILDEILGKKEPEGQTKNGKATIATATTQTEYPTSKERLQHEFAAEIRRVSTRQAKRLGDPSTKTPILNKSSSEEEALMELVVNDCPHLNLDKLAQLQRECSRLGPIYKNTERYPEYTKHGNILLKRFRFKEIKKILLCIPVTLADDLVSDLHRGVASTHAGEKKLRNLIRTRYFIPQLRSRTKKCVQNCGICNFYKPRNRGGPRPNAARITPKHPSDIWAMDIVQVTSKPDENGHDSLICFVDLYSHFLICKPIRKNITAKEAAELFLSEVIARFGVPRALLSDNASNMDNELWREMANLLCINKYTISPGSPKSNGICEKIQGLIVNAIKYQAAQYRVKPQDWASLAIWAGLAHNSTPFDNMEPPLSPAEIFLGRSIPESSFFGFANAAYSFRNLEDFNRHLVAAQMTISEIMATKQRHLDEMEEKKKILTAPHWDFPKGTLVALKDKTQPREDNYIKLRPKFKGVFIVVKQTPTSCLIRAFSSETILQDMESELTAPRGRGRPLPRYKIIKADKGDLKKISQLVFYSTPMAKKFVEHLKSDAPEPGQSYEVTRDDDMSEGDEILQREQEGDPEEDIYNLKRHIDNDDQEGDDNPAKIARIEVKKFEFQY